MAMVTLTPEAQEQSDELPVAIHARVLKLVERLRAWPNVSGARPLRGNLAGKYRLRTGDYRLQFRVEGETVIVERSAIAIDFTKGDRREDPDFEPGRKTFRGLSRGGL